MRSTLPPLAFCRPFTPKAYAFPFSLDTPLSCIAALQSPQLSSNAQAGKAAVDLTINEDLRGLSGRLAI
jgi:hypothetical protein